MATFKSCLDKIVKKNLGKKTGLALEEQFCIHLENECKWDSSLHSCAGWLRSIWDRGGMGVQCESQGDLAKVRTPPSAWRDPVGLGLRRDLRQEVRGSSAGFRCSFSRDS